MIVVIDYNRGNLFSIEQALRKIDVPYKVSGDPVEIRRAERLILPGVGAFGDAMKTLFSRGLVRPIREQVRSGVPILGICLGMQLLFEQSQEFGEHAGLALLEGFVDALPDGEMRIPNVGWRTLVPNSRNVLLKDIDPETMAYFVHSFVACPADAADIAATIPFNGTDAAIAVSRGNIVGYQFHPEKSGPAGLSLLKTFVDAPI